MWDRRRILGDLRWDIGQFVKLRCRFTRQRRANDSLGWQVSWPLLVHFWLLREDFIYNSARFLGVHWHPAKILEILSLTPRILLARIFYPIQTAHQRLHSHPATKICNNGLIMENEARSGYSQGFRNVKWIWELLGKHTWGLRGLETT